MMRKKMNNKGFSLVELIVVIAIMAILAVTLAPKLLQYVDRAREANDKGTVDTIFTTTKLTLTDTDYYNDFVTAATKIDISSTDGTDAYYVISLENMYNIGTNNKWLLKSPLTGFYLDLSKSLGNFQLKSKSAVAHATRAETDSDIFITYEIATGTLSAFLDYGGFDTSTTKYKADVIEELTGATTPADYVVSE